MGQRGPQQGTLPGQGGWGGAAGVGVPAAGCLSPPLSIVRSPVPHAVVCSPCSSSAPSEAGEVKRPRPSGLGPVHLGRDPLLRAVACLSEPISAISKGPVSWDATPPQGGWSAWPDCPCLPQERARGDMLHARLCWPREQGRTASAPPQAGALGGRSGGQGFPFSGLAGPLLPAFLPPARLPFLPPSTAPPDPLCQDAVVLCSVSLRGRGDPGGSSLLRRAAAAQGKGSRGEGEEQLWWAFPPAWPSPASLPASDPSLGSWPCPRLSHASRPSEEPLPSLS